MNKNTFTGGHIGMNQMTEGRSATVREINHSGGMRRRLGDIGLIKDTEVRCLLRSPAGDPVAYLIRGAVIALRNEDSAKIVVSPL